MKKNSEYKRFDDAMTAILKADPKAVKEAMDAEKQEHERSGKKRGPKPGRLEQKSGDLCSIKFDATEAEEQWKGLKDALKSRQLRRPFPDKLVHALNQLSSDILFRKGSTTLRTDGVRDVLIRVRFGASFENLRSAILAGEFSD